MKMTKLCNDVMRRAIVVVGLVDRFENDKGRSCCIILCDPGAYRNLVGATKISGIQEASILRGISKSNALKTFNFIVFHAAI